MEAILVKKISSKLMCGKVRDCNEGILYSVVGKVIGLKSGSSTYGDWTALKGDFEAWNEKQRCKSHLCFLPDILTLQLEIALADGNDDITFGVEVLKKNNDTTVGYEYEVRNIIPQKETNLLEDLRSKFEKMQNKDEKEKKKRKIIN